ncbi:MAG: NAD-dependent deacylase [Deltaproteobacteria bacterium]|nr:NAD-dependent deacylase [Deltaproteobacteria bacterium]
MFPPAPLDPEALERAARLLADAHSVVAFTGAGMSVESGIPDFRSDDGLWRRFPPEHYATIEVFHQNPDRVWTLLRAMGELVKHAVPNDGHRALAAMEAEGMLKAVITQNIDGLHTKAGSQQVLELHGTWRGLHCSLCFHVDPGGEALPDHTPICPRCGGPMKPPIVLFNEDLPQVVVTRAWSLAAEADLMLVIGTSLAVWPASDLPDVAAGNGAALVEVNDRPGALRYRQAVELGGAVAHVLPRLLERARSFRQP